MEHRFSMLPIWLAGLVVAVPFIAEGEFRTWKNRAGDTMEAEALDYDPETRMVTFRLEDGSNIEYPIEDLNAAGRLGAAFDPEVQESLRENGWTPPASYFLRILLLLLAFGLALWMTLGFLCFLVAARLITVESGVRFHFIGYLKLLAANFVVGIVGNAILYGPLVFKIINNHPIDLENLGLATNGWVQLLFSLIGIVVQIVVLSAHYEMGFGRSFLTLFCSGLFYIISVVLLIFITAVVATMIVPALQTETVGGYLVDEWILEPLKLL